MFIDVGARNGARVAAIRTVDSAQEGGLQLSLLKKNRTYSCIILNRCVVRHGQEINVRTDKKMV